MTNLPIAPVGYPVGSATVMLVVAEEIADASVVGPAEPECSSLSSTGITVSPLATP
jgi:hypothetical protein